ncbi:MAG: hypothetical protein CME62_12060 [Halobacteriovoraceae bacterium]|nr:hypothetical protein [Halobacteriovoraceae bacterium]
MDLKSLHNEGLFTPTYNHFALLLRKLEKAQIIKSYRHPLNRKKYVYLTRKGDEQFIAEHNRTQIDDKSLFHDLLVSEISRSFKNLVWINEAELEHTFKNKRSFSDSTQVIPDARFYIRKRFSLLSIAFELELTQKEKTRIEEKAKQYIINSQYDFVLYYFTKPTVADTYRKIIKEIYSGKKYKKFLFVVDMNPVRSNKDWRELEIIHKDSKVPLAEFFESLHQ